MRHVVFDNTGAVPSLFDEETAGLEPHAATIDDEDFGSNEARTFLEHHGLLDVNGVGVPAHMRTASALSNATGTERPDLIIQHGSAFVSDYNNPALFPGMFPLLYPWGIGGFESKRDVAVSFDKHAIYLLDLEDHAFRRHWSFVFVVANIKQRRAIHVGSKFVCKKKDFDRISRELSELDAQVVKRVAEHVALGGSQQTLSGAERRISTLLKKCELLSVRVPGSQAVMNRARADIRGYIGELGIFQLFLTINPRPEYGPPFQVFYGDTKIDIDVRVPKMPPRSTRAIQVADDPIAAADYFHFHLAAVFEYLFGWNVRSRTSSETGGLLGRLSAFFLVKEHTMRGQLHGHALIWLEGGLNPADLRQKLKVDEEFKTRYLAFMDDIIRHHLPPGPSTANRRDASEAVRQPRAEMPPHPKDEDYRERFEEDHHLLGEALQRHSCRATCFKGGRNTCRFHYPHALNNASTFDPTDNSVNLQIKDSTINWHNPELLVATRHNHDLKSVQSGKSSAAAAAYITSYATKSDETPANQIAMINTVFQRLQDNGEVLTETKALLTKCVMQFGRERQLHAQQVSTYVRELGDTFQSHTTVAMLSGAMLSKIFRLFGPLIDKASQNNTDVRDSQDTATGLASEVAISDVDASRGGEAVAVLESDNAGGVEPAAVPAADETEEDDDEDESLPLSSSGEAHQVDDYINRGETLSEINFYDFARFCKLIDMPKRPNKNHHMLAITHPNVETHC
ncbi:hypothetical protein A4X13_0g8983, partial [Tilletia indica]